MGTHRPRRALETRRPGTVERCSSDGACFTRSASRAHIGDGELCLAIQQVIANISPVEWVAFRKLAAAYGQMTAAEVNTGLRNGDLLEICDDGQGKV